MFIPKRHARVFHEYTLVPGSGRFWQVSKWRKQWWTVDKPSMSLECYEPGNKEAQKTAVWLVFENHTSCTSSVLTALTACVALGINVGSSDPKYGMGELKMMCDITQKLISQGTVHFRGMVTWPTGLGLDPFGEQERQTVTSVVEGSRYVSSQTCYCTHNSLIPRPDLVVWEWAQILSIVYRSRIWQTWSDPWRMQLLSNCEVS